MKNIISKIFAPLAIAVALLCAPIAAQAQFADQATYVATPGGTANAITLAVDNWNINRSGVVLRFLPAAQNTGATTVVVNGVGSPIALRKQTGMGVSALVGGELVTTQVASIVYDGTQWELLQTPPTATAPQGYLTPCQVSSPSPVSGCSAGFYLPTGDVTSATTLFYEGVTGNLVPIFNGGIFVPRAVTESQMTLILSATANTANNIYDVCVYDNGGTPAIGTMPAWSTPTAGSGARGTAAAIVQVNGLWVNNIGATVTNNNVGVAVAANRCTIVATILIDGVNGQVTFNRTYGQSRKWSAWNFYNAVPLYLKGGDPTASWVFNTLTAGQPSNSNSANNLRVVIGLPGIYTDIAFNQILDTSGSNSASDSGIMIGLNSTTTGTGKRGEVLAGILVGFTTRLEVSAKYIGVQQIGSNVYTMVQYLTANTNSRTFFGTETYMLMTAKWSG